MRAVQRLFLVAATIVVLVPISNLNTANGVDRTVLRPLDVFEIEYASEPQISSDGRRIVYVRNSMDIMKDR